VIKQFISKQFLAFLVAGGFAAAVNFMSRVLFSLWFSYAHAVIAAYIFGMLTAFILNIIYVFPKFKKKIKLIHARDFIIVNICFFPLVWLGSVQLNTALIYLGVNRFSEEISHFIALSLPIFSTFLIYKFFIFKENYYE
jgi:putative flippase GtrA